MQNGNNGSCIGGDIAIVGMAAQLPGAASIDAYWDNLRRGLCAIRTLDEATLLAAGERADRLAQPNYVPAAAPLDGFDQFDPAAFGFSPKDAAILDPQHRKFLEVAWQAFETAGHVPGRFSGDIGVYAGCGMGSYFYFNVCSHPDLVEETGMFLLRHTGNDKDFLATRVSHVFDLQGPSLGIQTACSTSLVAVHYAAQALRAGDCDMALAGGSTIELPQGRGYLYRENEVLSPDGRCHAFDARAQGTVFGSGAGAVLLRRLEDARADGDHIWAVLKGSAVNNDGAAKAGYLAPSVGRQADAAAAALDDAGVTAHSVSYVECHGTGTYLGDPIEVSALTDAFRRTTDASGHCRIGSVKTNIGHLDTAAGVASLIKVALSLHHGEIPPSLGYDSPNPAIDFERSPFRVNDTLTDWESDGPRRAGVNSLGVGGTNAHAVLEEAPRRGPSAEADWPFYPLCLSARTKSALDGNAAALAAHLARCPDQPLADIAFTLKEGRQAFERRRVVVAETQAEAARLLAGNDPRHVFTHEVVGDAPGVVFMFPGGGAQYPGMAEDLYETEPVFRDWMDRGLDVLAAETDCDMRALWLPAPEDRAAAADRLQTPSMQLPLIMIVEYALAQLWISWGVRPAALVGHSMGENTAACLAGVMTFDDCIRLVHLRGQLFDTVPAGGMLSVSLCVDALRPHLPPEIDIASINAPGLTVVSGPDTALEALAARLADREIDSRRVRIDIAAHSRMLDPILDRFHAFLASLDLQPPQMPIVSNRTGTWLTAAEATDPAYWVGHLRHTVRFADCIATLALESNRVYLEVGPGQALTSLAGQGAASPNQTIATMRHPDLDISDDACFVTALARLWATGVEADWSQIWGEGLRHRVPLPTYAFQRSRHFIEPAAPRSAGDPAPERLNDIADWGNRPVWQPVPAPVADTAVQTWLVFADDTGTAARLTMRLRAAGHIVTEVAAGDTFAQTGDDRYVLSPELGPEGYEALFADLDARDRLPTRIAHFWLVTDAETHRPGSSFFHRNVEQGLHSLLHLAQALDALSGPVHLTLATTGAAAVNGPVRYPEKAMAAAALGVIPRELPGVTCASVDFDMLAAPRKGLFRGSTEDPREAITDHLLAELLALPDNRQIALRDSARFALSYTRQPLPVTHAEFAPRTVLITGGFGGIGIAVARHLLGRPGTRVALLSRSALPPRDTWDGLLARRPADPVARRIRTLRDLEMLGDVRCLTADVCNLDDMQRAVAAVQRDLGPIDTVIHAAGAIADAPLLQKTVHTMEPVLAPKILGTQVLDQIFPDGTLDHLVLFASSSTVTRPAGQIDYVAANAFLNAFAEARQGGKTRVTAVDWGIWADVGMAADALSQAAPESVALPLLDRMLPRDDGQTYAADLTTDHWVLDDHRTADGTAVLPGTGYIELIAESAPDGPFEIRDLSFLRALQVADGTTSEVRVSVDAGRVDIRSAAALDGRRGYLLHAQATLGRVGPQPAALDMPALTARIGKMTFGTAPLRTPQQAHLTFGPRWQVLRGRVLGQGEGLASLTLPEDLRAADADCVLHPGLMDLATGWAVELAPGYDAGDLWVPVHYRRIAIYRPLPDEIVSWVRLAPSEDGLDGAEFAAFDVVLATPDGSVCVEVEGFSMKRLGPAAALGAPAPVHPSELVYDAAPGPVSAAETRLRQTFALGIRPEEGPDALGRAIATGLPQVVVTSVDLSSLQATVAAPPRSGSTVDFGGPVREAEAIAPRNPTEARLAEFWTQLLGAGDIGVEDSFFDLGGHSLIAVRLFAMVKREFGVEFPIALLFEAPTIAAIAERIEAAGGQPDAASDTPAAAPVSGGGHTHLVRLNQTEGGTPFFLVAGMFGNVMNLRHLAHLAGRDRAVWGLQARGLLGGMEPHTSLVDAAADYIAELRQVQPEGPYLLGGFSGGGVTAFEMARQLRTAGQAVAQLVLLDTPLPVRPPVPKQDKLLIRMHELRQGGPKFMAEWLRGKRAYARALAAAQDEAAAEAAGTGFQNAAIEAAFRHAVGQYDLSASDVPTVLFRPPLDRRWKVTGGRWVSTAREFVTPDNDWGPWASNLTVVEVPGDHDSMVLDPNVRVLGARLAAALDAADTSADPILHATAAE